MNGRTFTLVAVIIGGIAWPAGMEAQEGDCNACEQLIEGGSYRHRVIAAPTVLKGVTGNVHGWLSSSCSDHGHEEVLCNGLFGLVTDPDEAPISALAQLIHDRDQVILDTKSGSIEFPSCDGKGTQRAAIRPETQRELVAFLKMLSAASD